LSFVCETLSVINIEVIIVGLVADKILFYGPEDEIIRVKNQNLES